MLSSSKFFTNSINTLGVFLLSLRRHQLQKLTVERLHGLIIDLTQQTSWRSFLKTVRALIDVYKVELTLRVGKEAVTFNLDQTSRYSANYDVMSVNRIDLIDVACEHYSQEVLGFSFSGNPTPSTKPIVSNSSHTLTPFGDNLKVVEPTNEISSIDEPPVVELKDLPPHLEYAFLEGDDKLPIIIAKDLKDGEKTALIKTPKIKKRPHSRVLMERLPTAACLLGYAMHRARSKGEKSHFMVKEGIVLDHKICKNRIEVDKAKVDVIAKLPHPTTIKGIHSFHGHAGFYQRLIQDFSKIA
nr:reverse transcriptase domain-containing protein [Tanacetum cinerariifolium]